MTFLMRLFSTKKFRHVLGEIAMGALIVLVMATALAYLSIPVWFLTHHYHHSTFTWYAIWLGYAFVALCVGLIIVAKTD